LDAEIALSAVLADGQPLPSWITLNRKTGVFTFDPPTGWKGELQIKLSARDTQGREAATLLRLEIGEKRQSRASLSDKLREAVQQMPQRGAIPPAQSVKPVLDPA
jgi:hypothetical protein